MRKRARLLIEYVGLVNCYTCHSFTSPTVDNPHSERYPHYLLPVVLLFVPITADAGIYCHNRLEPNLCDAPYRCCAHSSLRNSLWPESPLFGSPPYPVRVVEITALANRTQGWETCYLFEAHRLVTGSQDVARLPRRRSPPMKKQYYLTGTLPYP